MNQHQKDQLQKNFKDNQAFFGAYMADLTAKRNMRAQSLDLAKGKNPADGKTIDEIISDAKKIYDYMTSDGDMEDLSTKSNVQLLGQ